LPGIEWQGEVDYLYPTLDSQTRTARVRIRFANPDHALKPGMYAQLSIAGLTTEETLLIPRQALIRTGDSNRVVLARGDGQFKSINVEVGRIVDEQVEILAGLEPGDRIVTSAQFLLDSESSKTSDFKRMEAPSEQSAAAEDALEPVWVEAEVTDVMADHRMVTLNHAPVEAWGWPRMTMNFMVDETLDMAQFEEGQNIRVQMAQGEAGSYVILQVEDVEGNSGQGSSGAGRGDEP
jgi:Cu(I)/Ag(I) efflux system membrane fusion protein